MNWNTYKQLQREDREEYEYKFGEGPDSGMGYLVTGVLISGFVYFHVFLFYVISISTNETLLQFKDIIGQIILQDLKVLVVAMWIIVFGLLYHAVMNIIYVTRRRLWLKKHNIKLGWRDIWK